MIKDVRASVIFAEENEIIGVAILIYEEFYLDKFRKYESLLSTVCIKDVVVSKDYSGKGIGNKLLNMRIFGSKNTMVLKKGHKIVYDL